MYGALTQAHRSSKLMKHAAETSVLTLADDWLLRGLGGNDAVELLQHVFEVALQRFSLPTHKVTNIHLQN